MYRPSQFQVTGFGVSADVPRITPQEFYYFCASTQITLFGISAGVRRKTPRDYYHFAHLRTIQCFGISADVRRKTAQDYFHFSAPTQVTIFFEFLWTYAEILRVSITILRIYAQFSVLEFLRIYANFIVVEM